MNTISTKVLFVVLGLLGTSHIPLKAEVQIRLSVKFILTPDGTRPFGGIGNATGFDAEVKRGNGILNNTGRGYRLVVAEYLDIQPPPPAGQPADYWWALYAGANRQTIENAALADQVTWRWNSNAINFYVNNSSDALCSFPGQGGSISLGAVNAGSNVLHEIGHFFSLLHTHAGDTGNNTSPPVFTAADLRDGDGNSDTANDNPNIVNHDQLSQALFGIDYNSATAPERATVDSAFENVMSYHNENSLLPSQMDIWTRTANSSRSNVCSGKVWFTAPSPFATSDPYYDGSIDTAPALLPRALTNASNANDVIQFLRDYPFDVFNITPPFTITQPVTLTARSVPVTIGAR